MTNFYTMTEESGSGTSSSEGKPIFSGQRVSKGKRRKRKTDSSDA